MYACNEYGRGIKRPASVVYMVMPEDSGGKRNVWCVSRGYSPRSQMSEQRIGAERTCASQNSRVDKSIAWGNSKAAP